MLKLDVDDMYEFDGGFYVLVFTPLSPHTAHDALRQPARSSFECLGREGLDMCAVQSVRTAIHFFIYFFRRRRHQVGIDPTAPVTGAEADVMLAAYYAAEVAAKTIKAGNTNIQVRQCGKNDVYQHTQSSRDIKWRPQAQLCGRFKGRCVCFLVSRRSQRSLFSRSDVLGWLLFVCLLAADTTQQKVPRLLQILERTPHRPVA